MPFLKYFLASNSKNGFVNYFPSEFNREKCKKIYVIKGGAGTGKSRLMRDVGEHAEKLLMNVRYYYCSSDSGSLDGVIIDELGVGILDGTPPHVFEPSMPGVFEELINLGEFWDSDKLLKRSLEISELVFVKSGAYKRAYSLLSSLGKVVSVRNEILEDLVYKKKIRGAVKRLLHNLPNDNGGKRDIGLCRSIGMDGRSHFDTYERSAKTLYSINDFYGTSRIFLDEVRREADRQNMSYTVSYSPVMNDDIDAIRLEESGVVFSLCGDGKKKINMSRFVDLDAFKRSKDEVKALEREIRSLGSLIDNTFVKVREAHFALEAIYSDAMDFGKKEQFTKEFIERIFKEHST